MPGSPTDKFRVTTSGTRPEVTYLDAPKSIGSSTGSLHSANGWGTETATDFIIYRKDATTGKYDPASVTTWKATLSGTALTNMTLVAGVDQSYPAGELSVVQATPTAAWSTDLVKGILVGHNQDGSHKPLSTDAIADASITTPKIADGSIGLAKLSSNALRLGIDKKNTTGTLIPNSYTTFATITAISTGKECEVYYSVNFTNLNSGSTRVLLVRVQCDGVDISPAGLAYTAISLAGDTPTYNGSFTVSSTPTAGSHTWTLQMQASATSSMGLQQTVFKVSEVV
jgi:hypothetical protein